MALFYGSLPVHYQMEPDSSPRGSPGIRNAIKALRRERNRDYILLFGQCCRNFPWIFIYVRVLIRLSIFISLICYNWVKRETNDTYLLHKVITT